MLLFFIQFDAMESVFGFCEGIGKRNSCDCVLHRAWGVLRMSYMRKLFDYGVSVYLGEASSYQPGSPIRVSACKP